MIRLIFMVLFAAFLYSNTILAKDDAIADGPNIPKPISVLGIDHFSDGHNLIRNGDFSDGTTNWVLGKFNGASAILTIDSASRLNGENSALINIFTTDNKASAIKLFQDMPVEGRTKYSLKFQAKVMEPMVIEISISSDFQDYWKEEVLLLPGQLQYGPFTFGSEAADYTATLVFDLGRDPGKINIDAVSVVGDFANNEFEKLLSSSGINSMSNSSGGSFKQSTTSEDPISEVH